MSKLLSESCVEMLLAAEGKALATIDSAGLPHVVPVSTVRFEGGQIILVNYFFGQTLKNLLANPKVAFSFWKGFKGYQIKGVAAYEIEGERFLATEAFVKQILPDRLVRGIVIITPERLFDISAGGEAGKELV